MKRNISILLIVVVFITLFLKLNFFDNFENRIILSIRINKILTIKKTHYKISNYTNFPWKKVFIYNIYNENLHKFEFINNGKSKVYSLKLDKHGELSKNQLLLKPENINESIYFECDYENAYIQYIGINDQLNSYDFIPLGCQQIKTQ